MLARKCDRCGSFYDIYREDVDGHTVNALVLTVHDVPDGISGSIYEDIPRTWNRSYKVDVCKQCLADVVEFLTPKKGDAQNEVNKK